ncbi:MAG: enoyl-CoA hydratase/isomerase family protein [Pseudomonadota bacterium]
MIVQESRFPQLDIAGSRATIKLARLEEHNRIDPSDIPHLMRLLDQVETNPEVRVLVLTGSGARTFSSGYTITAILTDLNRGFEDLLNRLENFSLPTVCALNGSVYGGGTDLAICCDFRIGVKGMRMFVPAARFGLHYYPGGIRRFTTRLGPGAAKKIFLTCLPLGDEEMLRIGFLTELVGVDQLSSTVDTYVQALTEAEQGVLASMKKHIDRLADGDTNEALGQHEYQASLRSSELANRLAKLAKR